MKKLRFSLLMVLFLILISINQAYCDSEDRPMSPIFDGKDGLYPELKLIRCYGYDQTFNPGIYSDLGFQSTKVIRIDESWAAKKAKNTPDTYIGRLINITRYYFQYSNDPLVYLKLPDDRITTSSVIPPWPEKADIGEKTIWFSDDYVIFVKGKVLVQLHVNSKKLYRNYIEKIAHIIEKKL
ncbi:MAG: hypothetical protein AB9903_27400 [Vulcanimicrobiota bacterium]